MGDLQQHDVIAMIRQLIEKRQREIDHAEPTSIQPLWTIGESPFSVADEPSPRSQIERLEDAIYVWMLGVSAVGHLVELRKVGWGWARSWLNKAWLTQLVGWEALTPEGKAAGSAGYDLLLRWMDAAGTSPLATP